MVCCCLQTVIIYTMWVCSTQGTSIYPRAELLRLVRVCEAFLRREGPSDAPAELVPLTPISGCGNGLMTPNRVRISPSMHLDVYTHIQILCYIHRLPCFAYFPVPMGDSLVWSSSWLHPSSNISCFYLAAASLRLPSTVSSVTQSRALGADPYHWGFLSLG